MIVRKTGTFAPGYTTITALDGPHSEQLLDFGILVLQKGQQYACTLPLERAWLLIRGKVIFTWDGGSAVGERRSCIDESAVALHAPASVLVEIEALEESELAVERCRNTTDFPVRFYDKDDVRSEIFGAGVLAEASNRTVAAGIVLD